jgi:hypothetical protein
MTSINFLKGTAATEQLLVTDLDTFLTGTCGWSRIGTISDTVTDRDYVFFSRGSVVGKYRDIYVRVRGNGDAIWLWGYTRWSSVSNSDETPTADNNTATGTALIAYWMFGNQDWFWLVIKNNSTAEYRSMFGGYIDTFYPPEEDDLPLAIVSHRYASTNFSGSSRIKMYVPFNVSSGTAENFSGYDASTLLSYGSPNIRNASLANYPVVVVNANATAPEVRGVLPGVLGFYGSTLTTGTWYIVSGTEDKFFRQKYSDAVCYGYGPIPSGTVV